MLDTGIWCQENHYDEALKAFRMFFYMKNTHAGNISVGELSENVSDGSCNLVWVLRPCLSANWYF